jgi:hypothetical protein
VPDDLLPPRSSRPRPLADAPVEELVACAEELARRWGIALILARPLEQMATVPLEEIARVGPAVCAALARALGSDHELESFAGDPGAHDAPARSAASAAGLDALAASWDGPTAAANIEALRGVLWQAALQQLHEPSARLVADLADRLAFVCAALLGHVLLRASRPTPGDGVPRSIEVPGEQVLYSSPRQPGVVLIDERGESRSAAPHVAAGASRTAPRPLPWDTPLRP